MSTEILRVPYPLSFVRNRPVLQGILILILTVVGICVRDRSRIGLVCASAGLSIAETSPKPFPRLPSFSFVSLADALEPTLLLANRDPEKYNRAALRWHVRFVEETKNVDIRESLAVLALLAAIPGQSPGSHRPRRAPEPAAVVRANSRGPCPLVEGGVKLSPWNPVLTGRRGTKR